jgi:hypothetical protein
VRLWLSRLKNAARDNSIVQAAYVDSSKAWRELRGLKELSNIAKFTVQGFFAVGCDGLGTVAFDDLQL